MEVVFFANWLIAYFTHNTGKVPVVEPPEFQHFFFITDKHSQTFLGATKIM